jgi:hypothetical protein
MNLSLDDFDDDYIDRMSSTSCPNCRAHSRLGTLLSRFENDHLRLDFRAIPKPLPVILYLARRTTDQAKRSSGSKSGSKKKTRPALPN